MAQEDQNQIQREIFGTSLTVWFDYFKVGFLFLIGLYEGARFFFDLFEWPILAGYSYVAKELWRSLVYFVLGFIAFRLYLRRKGKTPWAGVLPFWSVVLVCVFLCIQIYQVWFGLYRNYQRGFPVDFGGYHSRELIVEGFAEKKRDVKIVPDKLKVSSAPSSLQTTKTIVLPHKAKSKVRAIGPDSESVLLGDRFKIVGSKDDRTSLESLDFVHDKARHLVLENFYISNDRIVQLPNRIQSLTLVNCSGFKDLRVFRFKHQNLNKIEIKFCKDFEGLRGLSWISFLRRKHLNVVRLEENPNLVDVSDLRGFKNVLVLEISESPKLKKLDAIEDLRLLEVLRLTGLQQFQASGVVGGLRNLKTLSLKNTGIQSLGVFRNSTKLDTLEVSSNPLLGFGNIEAAGIKNMPPPLVPFPLLTTIRWVGPISPQGLAALYDASPCVFCLELTDINIDLDLRLLAMKAPLCSVLKLGAIYTISNPGSLVDLPLRKLSLSSLPPGVTKDILTYSRNRKRFDVEWKKTAELEELDLSSLDFKSEALELSKFSGLRMLVLERLSGNIDWFSISKSNLPLLRCLRVNNCETLNDVTFLSSLDQLEVLELASERYQLKNIDSVNLTSLRELKLSGNVALKSLGFLAKAVSLEKLILEGLESYLVLKLPFLPKLSHFSVRYCINLKALDFGKNHQVREIELGLNYGDLLHVQGTNEFKSMTHISLPRNLVNNRLGSYFLPRQVRDLETLKIRLR